MLLCDLSVCASADRFGFDLGILCWVWGLLSFLWNKCFIFLTWVKLFDFLGALFVYYYKISFLYTLFDSRRKNTSLVFNHCKFGFDVLRELNLGRKVGVRYMSLFLGQIVITGLLWIWQQTFQKVVLEVKISFNIKLF